MPLCRRSSPSAWCRTPGAKIRSPPTVLCEPGTSAGQVMPPGQGVGVVCPPKSIFSWYVQMMSM